MAPKPVDVEIRATGVDGVQRQLKLVGDQVGTLGGHGDQLGEKYGRAGNTIAGAFLMAAHAGDLSTREMKELVREGGEMATMFGGAGPIVGGVVLLGVALYEAFSRGQEQLNKAREKTDELNEAHVRLAAELRGDRLAVNALGLRDAYEKEIKDIEKDAPGWGARLVAAFGRATMSGDVFNIASRQAEIEKQKKQAQENVYGTGPESEQHKTEREERDRLALADAGAFGQGTDPVERYKAQLRVIELEREKAIDNGELSEEAADARAAGKRQALARAGEDMQRQVAERLSDLDNARTLNVFDRRQEIANRALTDESKAVEKLTLSDEERRKILNDIRLIHQATTDEITKQRKETEAMAHATAQQGDLNPVERIRGELAAIDLRKTKSIEAGTKEVDAARIAENEKRDLFLSSVDAAVRSNGSLAKIATKLALDPLVTYLEGLAIKEGIKAAEHFAALDFVGGTAHAAVAAAALAGAHEVASLAGGSAGGGGGGRGGSGGLSASSVGASTGSGQTRTTVVFKGKKQIYDMTDPEDRAQLVAAIKAIAGDGDIDFLFDAA